jgi:ABC-2 type transport system ATP-binding protein
MTAALSVEGVSHAYGTRRVLDNVSLIVPQGQFTAVLGLNGAGKTTLLSLITRLFDTQSGTISVLGYRIDRKPGEALRRLGVVFQARTLDMDLSVMENLLFHASLHGIGGREARRRATEALTDVDMEDRARDKARNLSGGQMRRVEIARALLHGPRLLVLDEPTVGLDIASKLAIVRHVRALVRDRGVGVLWTTHLLDEIEPTDHLLVLHKGKPMARGIVSDVVATSGTDTLRAAFASLTEREASQ